MAYKIFTRGNYLIILDDVNNVENEALRKDVLVRRENSNSDNFRFSNVNGITTDFEINISDIKKENGDDYTLNEFITFYTENTGNFNGGGTAPVLSISGDGVDNTDPQNPIISQSNDWGITGNIGTTQANNFIGTSDNIGLSFRTNNIIRQTITNSGFIGIGTNTPNSTLTVGGSESSSYLSITSNITLGSTHRYVVIPTGSVFTITLPTPIGFIGRVYKITNKTIVNKTIGGYVNLSGATVTTIPAKNSVELISNGTTWQQV